MQGNRLSRVLKPLAGAISNDLPAVQTVSQGQVRSMLRDRWLWNHLGRTISGVIALSAPLRVWPECRLYSRLFKEQSTFCEMKESRMSYSRSNTIKFNLLVRLEGDYL